MDCAVAECATSSLDYGHCEEWSTSVVLSFCDVCMAMLRVVVDVDATRKDGDDGEELPTQWGCVSAGFRLE